MYDRMKNECYIGLFLCAFQVVAGSSWRGWLEPIPEMNWLKEIQTAHSISEANVQSFLVAGYVSILRKTKFVNLFFF